MNKDTESAIDYYFFFRGISAPKRVRYGDDGRIDSVMADDVVPCTCAHAGQMTDNRASISDR